MMKRITALLLIVALLALAGCASDTASFQEVVKEQPSAQASTQEAVEDVDAAFEDVDELENSLDLSELDSLDEELNFE